MVAIVITSYDEENDENDEKTLVPLCKRCFEEIFNEESWTKLFGVHPKTPGLGASFKTSDACFDGEFQYNLVGLDPKNLPPRRCPILRLRIPVEDLLVSAPLCGFCQIVVGLDTKGDMAKGRYKGAQVDIQLFCPVKRSDPWLPFVMQIALTLESQKNKKKQEKWQNKTLVALLFRSGKIPTLCMEDEISPSRMKTRKAKPLAEDTAETRESNDREVTVPNLVDGLLDEAWQWLQECEDNHSSCGLAHESLLPVRVLDVQAFESTGRLKLIESNEQQHGRYVALSYVWGSIPFLRLLCQNRDELMNAISLEDLPKTIQDAVHVTRALKVRYLWVDSLCILQDSDTDKEMQIPHMNAYYREAVAVISASGATDVYAGFLQFQSAKDDVLARAKNRLVADDPEFGPMSYTFLVHWPSKSRLQSSVVHVDVDPPLYNYDKEPINNRGWTFQESTLARRLLIFPMTGGIIMRCSKGEDFAGNLLGDPFHEEAGSLNHELNTSELSGNRDGEDMADGDSESSGAKGEGTEDQGQGDDTEDEHHQLEKEVNESGSEDQDVEYESNDENNRSLELQKESERESFSTDTKEEDEMSRSDQADRKDVDDESVGNDDDGVDNDEHTDNSNSDDEVEVETEEYSKQDEISENWYASVRDYSQRALSQPDDILIALGGLAQHFHSLHEDVIGNYAAGLWTETLKAGLLWHVSYPPHSKRKSFIQPRKLTSEYRAPSWSWASSEQPVTFRTHREPDLSFGNFRREEPTWCVEIVKCSVTPRTERNPFGAVETGYIDVKGLLMPLRRVPRKNGDTSDGCDVDDVALVEGGSVSDHNNTDLFAPDSIDAVEKIDSSCYWLPVYDATRGRMRGLILCKMVSGLYQRLGFAEFQVYSSTLKSTLAQDKRVLIRLV